VKRGSATPEEIARLVEFTKANGGIDYAFDVMDEYKEKALAILYSFAPSQIRTSLEVYLDYVVERKK